MFDLCLEIDSRESLERESFKMQKRDPKTGTGICVLEMIRRLGYKSIGSGISFERGKRTVCLTGEVKR